MIRRLGYACIALGSTATTNRTCRLTNATPERLRELIALNLGGLAEVLHYNTRLNIRFFRVSSMIVPFASHPINTIPWWEEFADELADIGRYAISQRMRLSMHPGQHTVLSSPRVEVVDAAIRDLVYHARFLGALGLNREHKIVVHAGGTYGDRAKAVDRFVEAFERLSGATAERLVLENDERSYSAEAVLGISARTGIPVVFDALHDRVLSSPGSADRPSLLAECFRTWHASDGPPIVHFSSQDPGKQPGAHAEWIDPAEFLAFAQDTGPTWTDCMLEAKGKELALLRLRQALAPVATEATLSADERLSALAVQR